jgi:hypothetical protein
MVARTARSPGFGTPLAFPVSQWRFEWRPGRKGQVPVTVAGPRRTFTGFRVIPVRVSSVVLQPLVYRFDPRPAREASSNRFSRARSSV